MRDHEGHDTRRGPMVEFTGGTGFVCLTCKVAGVGPYEALKDVARWTDEDYEANKDWIEAR